MRYRTSAFRKGKELKELFFLWNGIHFVSHVILDGSAIFCNYTPGNRRGRDYIPTSECLFWSTMLDSLVMMVPMLFGHDGILFLEEAFADVHLRTRIMSVSASSADSQTCNPSEDAQVATKCRC